MKSHQGEHPELTRANTGAKPFRTKNHPNRKRSAQNSPENDDDQTRKNSGETISRGMQRTIVYAPMEIPYKFRERQAWIHCKTSTKPFRKDSNRSGNAQPKFRPRMTTIRRGKNFCRTNFTSNNFTPYSIKKSYNNEYAPKMQSDDCLRKLQKFF